MLSLHVATISVQVTRFNRKRKLQNSFVTNEGLSLTPVQRQVQPEAGTARVRYRHAQLLLVKSSDSWAVCCVVDATWYACVHTYCTYVG